MSRKMKEAEFTDYGSAGARPAQAGCGGGSAAAGCGGGSAAAGCGILPKALVTAARTFAKKPAVVGEVIVALVAADGDASKPLSDVQRYIYEACREELAELAERRAVAAWRKRRQRSRASDGAAQDGKGETR